MASLFSVSFGDVQEFMRILAAGGFDSEAVEYLKKHPELAKELRNMIQATEEDMFAFYKQYLWSLPKQATELRRLNSLLPKNIQVPDVWFDNLDTESNHVQSVKDYEFLCPIPEGGISAVFNYLCCLLRLVFPKHARFQDDSRMCDLQADLKHGIWLDSTAESFRYEKPGIHWLRIDFTTGWIEPDKRKSSNRTSALLERKKAKEGNYHSAGLLSLSARVLIDIKAFECQPWLFRGFSMDDIRCGVNGEKVPYAVITKNDGECELTSFINTMKSDGLAETTCHPSLVNKE